MPVGNMRFKMEDIEGFITGDEYIGLCTVCGEEQEGCEPDARNYKCDACGAKAVYGAEELLIMGKVD